MDAAYITNKGKTSQNQEDSLLIAGGVYHTRESDNMLLFGGAAIQSTISKAVSIAGPLRIIALSDGIAGLKYGQKASFLTLSYLFKILKSNPELSVFQAIRKTQETLTSHAIKLPKYQGMGATLAGILFDSHGARIFNVGDSRVYLYRNSELRQLSVDHTVARKMVQNGELQSEESCANAYKMLDSAIVASDDADDFEIHTDYIPLQKGDKFLVCTDGVTDMVDDGVLAKYFAKYQSVDELTQKIYQKAMRNGGLDNLTLVSIFV